MELSAAEPGYCIHHPGDYSKNAVNALEGFGLSTRIVMLNMIKKKRMLFFLNGHSRPPIGTLLAPKIGVRIAHQAIELVMQLLEQVVLHALGERGTQAPPLDSVHLRFDALPLCTNARV
jgi:hypothetical protein